MWLAPLLPGDYFVDALAGSNTTGTGVAANPWQTITHALAQATGPSDRIHVAAGTYGYALGESFPLLVKPGVSLVGAGPSVTTIDAIGSVFAAVRFDPLVFIPETRLEGFRITNSGPPAIRVDALDASGIRIVRNVVMGNGTGLRVQGNGSAVGPFLEENEFGFNASNVLIVTGAAGTTASPRFSGDQIHHSSGHGISISAGAGGLASPLLEGVRFEDNAGAGLWASVTSGLAVLYPSNLTVVQNALGGLVLSASGAGLLSVSLDQSTVADNGAAGISASGGAAVAVSNSIVHGNAGSDLVGVPVGTVSTSLVGTGAYAGQNGNLGGDPLFVDRANGNFQLSAGSPALEAAAPSAGLRDAYGDSRPLDGNLDGIEAPDMGSDELAHAHLEILGAPILGGTVLFDLTGSPGIQAHILLSSGTNLFPLPYWGVLLLAFPFVQLAGAGGMVPVSFPAAIPVDPALLGLELFFQPYGYALSGTSLYGSLGNLVRFRID
jgi:hypothetical protein